MPQFARQETKCQAAPAPFGTTDVRIDIEVLADRYEALAALSSLEDVPQEETDDTEEALDDLPF